MRIAPCSDYSVPHKQYAGCYYLSFVISHGGNYSRYEVLLNSMRRRLSPSESHLLLSILVSNTLLMDWKVLHCVTLNSKALAIELIPIDASM